MMDPDWDDLRVFLAVARGGGLSAAGRSLRMDPATVGRRVQRLEDRLGAALFLKSPQGYALTEVGERMVAPAEAAETGAEAATAAARGEVGALTGQVRIGAPDGCANFLLPQVCAGIAAANPGLDVQIVALPRIVNLSRREADMAITVSRPATGRLTVQKIADYRLSLAAHRRYLRDAPALVTLADLPAHRVVGYIPDMIFDPELDYLAAAGIDRVAVASNSIPVQLRLIAQGAGVGIVHDFARPFARGVTRVVPDFSLTRSFWLVRHATDHRLPRLARFAEALASGMRAEIARLESLA
jgi:DNA-binding transcriptional LysR family regulator